MAMQSTQILVALVFALLSNGCFTSTVYYSKDFGLTDSVYTKLTADDRVKTILGKKPKAEINNDVNNHLVNRSHETSVLFLSITSGHSWINATLSCEVNSTPVSLSDEELKYIAKRFVDILNEVNFKGEAKFEIRQNGKYITILDVDLENCNSQNSNPKAPNHQGRPNKSLEVTRLSGHGARFRHSIIFSGRDSRGAASLS